MKKWHIAALVIVGLIVAYTAYTMYEKKNAWRRDAMWRHAQKQVLNNNQRQKDSPTIVPGDAKNEPERPAGPVFGPENAPKDWWAEQEYASWGYL